MADEIRRSNRLGFGRRILRSRLLSGIVAIGYLLFIALPTGSLQSVFFVLSSLSLPMACIWFPDVMGKLKGISLGVARPMIALATPGDFVAIGGWLLLLCPAIMALVVRA